MRKQTHILIAFLLLVIMGFVFIGLLAYLIGPHDPRVSYAQMTVRSILATNTKIQSYIYASNTAKAYTRTPTPQYLETEAIATHHADNTHAYSTATALAISPPAR